MILHPLHQAWERLPTDWTPESPVPPLEELVQLHHELELGWLASPVPSSAVVERDISMARQRANEHGLEETREIDRMLRSFATLAGVISARLVNLSPILGMLYLRHCLAPAGVVISSGFADLQTETLRSVLLAGLCMETGVECDPRFFAGWARDFETLLLNVENVIGPLEDPELEPGEKRAVEASFSTTMVECFEALAVSTLGIEQYLDEITDMDKDRITAALHAFSKIDDLGVSHLSPARVISLRLHAAAMYFDLRGLHERALELAIDGITALLDPYRTGEKESLDDWDKAQLLKLFTAKAEAAVSLGLPALDEGAVGFITQFTTSARSDWLDLIKPQMTDDWNEHFTMHMLARLLVLGAGSKQLAAGVSIEFAPQISGDGAEGIQLLRSLHAREDASVDRDIDHFQISQRILDTVTANNERRVRAEALLRKAVADFARLSEDSQNELLDAELGYRGILAGDGIQQAARSVALGYFYPVERLTGERRKSDSEALLRARRLRNDAAHPEHDFDESKLTKLRNCILGIEQQSVGVLNELLARR